MNRSEMKVWLSYNVPITVVLFCVACSVLYRFLIGALIAWSYLCVFVIYLFTFIPVLEKGKNYLEIFAPINAGVSLMNLLFLMFERSKNHKARLYERTCTIGWNTFVLEKQKDGTYRYKLIMPSEVTFDLHELFEDDPELEKKVFEAMKRVDKNYLGNDGVNHQVEDFIVYLDNPAAGKDRHKDQEEFMRRLLSKISSVVNSSNWGESTHNGKLFNRDVYEPVKCLFTFEKDAPVKTPRIWLIFKEELEMFQNFKESFDYTIPELDKEVAAVKKQFAEEEEARRTGSAAPASGATSPLPPPSSTSTANTAVATAQHPEEPSDQSSSSSSPLLDVFPFNYFRETFTPSPVDDPIVMKAKTNIWSRKIDSYFKILQPAWYLRVVNLQKWAAMEQKLMAPDDKGQRPKLMTTLGCSKEVFLPYHRKTEQKILCQWVTLTPDTQEIKFLMEDKSVFASYFPPESGILEKVLMVVSKMRKAFDTRSPIKTATNTTMISDLSPLTVSLLDPKKVSETTEDEENFQEHIQMFLGLTVQKSRNAQTVQGMLPGSTAVLPGALREAIYWIYYDPKYQQTYLWITVPELFQAVEKNPNFVCADERKKQLLLQWKEKVAAMANQNVVMPRYY